MSIYVLFEHLISSPREYALVFPVIAIPLVIFSGHLRFSAYVVGAWLLFSILFVARESRNPKLLKNNIYFAWVRHQIKTMMTEDENDDTLETRCQRQINSDPSSYVGYYNMGCIATSNNMHWFQESIARNPNHAPSYYNLSCLYDVGTEESRLRKVSLLQKAV
eukprot:PhF_6_TR38978/c0_g1_i2/m.58329